MDPNTATNSRSIWSNINRKLFETRINALQGRHFIGKAVFPLQDNGSPQLHYPMDVRSEGQLADDFAFIAAYEPHCAAIYASTVELNELNKSINIRLAGNRGVRPEVRKAFESITNVMRLSARRGSLRTLYLYLNI
jgi:hypothetical protein